MKNEIDYNKIKDFYNEHSDCWGTDLFSRMTTSFIDNYVNKRVAHLNSDIIILNAGSGGKQYQTGAIQYQIDIAENTLKGKENAFVGSITEMPFYNNMFDVVICVGTVINYCDADKALSEIRRVLKKKAILIIEYERSESGLVDKNTRGVDRMIFRHNYFSEIHENYLYSDKYFFKLLEKNGFVVEEKEYFNAVIPYFEMIFPDTIAHMLTIFEPLLRKIKFISRYSHNLIMTCRKE